MMSSSRTSARSLLLLFASARAPLGGRGHLAAAALLAPLLLASCNRHRFPSYGANQREFAYVSGGASDTVAVLDLISLREDRSIPVGRNPTGLALNPINDEVYAVNTDSESVSVIDAAKGEVIATIGVHSKPHFIGVAPNGKRAYVANAGANTVSVLDLGHHRELATAGTGESPLMARVAPDGRSLVVSNTGSGSVSVYSLSASDKQPIAFRDAFSGCAGASNVVILPDSTKAFIACTGAKKIMAIGLGAAADSWRGKQDASLQQDHLLALLDVGSTPTDLALKRDGGEVFSTNFDSDTVSEMSTWTNEVGGTYTIGSKPSHAVISHDDSTVWITNFGADSVSLYSIDDGKLEGEVRAGSGPQALAFSADEHLLLVANTRSGDVAAIRTQSKNGPELVTMLPGGGHPNDIVVKAFSVK